jgi:hypothetical protein
MKSHIHVNYVVFCPILIAFMIPSNEGMRNSRRTPSRSGRRTLAMILLHAIGDRLHKDGDLRARQHGWQVTTRRGGMARTYRDPRFDQFKDREAALGARAAPDTEGPA